MSAISQAVKNYWTVHPPERTLEQDAAEKYLLTFYVGKNRYVNFTTVKFSRWYLLAVSFFVLFGIGMVLSMPADKLSYNYDGKYYYTALGVLDNTIHYHAREDDINTLVSNQSVMTYVMVVSVFGATSALMGPWIERHSPRTGVWVGTIAFFVGSVICAIAVGSDSEDGAVMLGYGVFCGVGMGLCFVSSVSAVLKWFSDLRGAASGLLVTGYGVGVVVWRSVYQPTTNTYRSGVGFEFLPVSASSAIFSAVAFAMCTTLCVCAVVLRSPPHDFSVGGLNIHGERVAAVDSSVLETPAAANEAFQANDGSLGRGRTLRDAILSPDFVCMYIMFFANQVFGWIVLPQLLGDCLFYQFDYNSQHRCDDLVTVVSVVTCCGTLLLPLLSDIIIKVFKLEPAFTRKCIFLVMLLAQTIAVAMTFGATNSRFANSVTSIAIFYGAGFGLIPSFLTDIFGAHTISATYGLFLTAWTIGTLENALTFNPRYDWHRIHGYSDAYIHNATAAMVMLPIGLFVACFIRTNRNDRFARWCRFPLASKFSACCCTISCVNPDADNIDPTVPTTKDGDAYVVLPDSPAHATDADTKLNPTVFPDAHVLVPYRIPYNKITFGQVITQGGFGEVLRAKYNNQDVAIKRLLAVRRKDHQSIRRFINEIELTASLEHECVVQFIGAAWEDPSSLCMVSEYMYGGDLRVLLERYARTGHENGHDDTKLRIAVQVAHATAYLHSLNPPVIHRDLKSRNVLLTATMDAKVIDFGVSREERDETMTANVGTSLWMAPEVMLGMRYDEKADVFSFGVILSELDTHALPYDHARDPSSNRKLTSIVLQQLIIQGRLKPRFTDKAHPAIVGLARDCLDFNPRQRPTASELVYRITQCLQYDPTLTEQTRSAIDRSFLTVETRSTTRYSPTSRLDTFRTPHSLSMDTRETTREVSL